MEKGSKRAPIFVNAICEWPLVLCDEIQPIPQMHLTKTFLVRLAHGGDVLAHLSLPGRPHAPPALRAVAVRRALVPLAHADHPLGPVHASQTLEKGSTAGQVSRYYVHRTSSMVCKGYIGSLPHFVHTDWLANKRTIILIPGFLVNMADRWSDLIRDKFDQV